MQNLQAQDCWQPSQRPEGERDEMILFTLSISMYGTAVLCGNEIGAKYTKTSTNVQEASAGTKILLDPNVNIII